jgi:SAM-dependent methyltransferase/4-hydroxybenzoate polyprenyltransferase
VTSARTVVRASQWWGHKVPPLLGIAYLVLLGSGTTPVVGAAAGSLLVLALLVAIVGVAGFGHVVNDLSDLEVDAAAGKPNALAPLAAQGRALVLLATVVLAAAPWLVLPTDRAVWTLLAVQVGLLVCYSVPPVRLKSRAAGGVLADALYAQVVPLVLTVATLGGAGEGQDTTPLVVAVGVWGLFVGLRGILYHQVDDLAADLAAGTRTLVAVVGPGAARRAAAVLTGAEVVALGVLTVVASERVPWFGPALLAAFAWRGVQLLLLAGFLDDRPEPPSARFVGFQVLNHTYERWLPLIPLVALLSRSGGYVVLAVAHLVLLPSGAVEVVRRDLPNLRGAMYNASYWRALWRIRRQSRRLQSARPVVAPEPAGEDHDGAFVFVVCGPAEYLGALDRAVVALRAHTDRPIWLLTDSRRNEREPPAVDHVVDVATPAELDDHQASIWLKTSVHRHLPSDRAWCYLDSDVIAVDGRVDEVFRFCPGPVAFALDLPIVGQCVDRFSPWAMDCDCEGIGHRESCEHLREHLACDLGVEVPGGWVHWNGGLFVFRPEGAAFLDDWHDLTMQVFAMDGWRTRDQGSLIATVWKHGMQDAPTLPQELNFIVDLGNFDISWFGDGVYGIDGEDGGRLRPALLHLYTSALEDPSWSIGRDVHRPIQRQMARRHVVVRGPRGPVRWWRDLFEAWRQEAARLRRPWPRIALWWHVGYPIWAAVLGTIGRAREAAKAGLLPVAVRFTRDASRDDLRMRLFRRRQLSTDAVEHYYDEWTPRYLEGFGDVFQTYRSQDPADFLCELAERAGIPKAQRVLDAGCGVGGVAVLYAERFGVHVDGVTVSQAQVDEARRLVAERGLEDRVEVVRGDFHLLEDLYPPDSFDVVYFQESLVHSKHPRVVLESAFRVLKPGGTLSIKDLYRTPAATAEDDARIDVAVRNTNRGFELEVRPRQVVLDAARRAGFEVVADEVLELHEHYDWDTGNLFVLAQGIDIWEGEPIEYLQHAEIRARKPW